MKYGAVAAGHRVTAETAMAILKEGGTAIDAAIAAYATACVAEPCMASMAAGGFATIYSQGEISCIDFFCQTPGVKSQSAILEPIHVDFGTAQEIYYGGAGAIAVPGVVKGLFEMHARYGSLPMEVLFDQARQHAKEGVPLTGFQHLDLGLLQSIFRLKDRGREIFFETGEMIGVGDNIKMEFLDGFLDALSREGQDLFYQGEVSRLLDKMSNENGGHLSRLDLERYNIRWTAPTSFQKNKSFISMPGGPSMGHAMYKMFDSALDLGNFSGKPFSDDHLQYLIPGLQSRKNLLEYRELLFRLAGVTDSDAGKMTGTSHINVLDGQGMAISMTFSIGEGSGIFLEGTDVHLNNMLGEPSLLPNGLNSWPTDRRLASMMTPIIVTKEGRLNYLLGTGGAERIPVILSTVIHYLIDQGMSLKEAIDAPRVYYSNQQLEVEVGFAHEKVKESLPLRYWDEQSLYFGGVHGIHIENDEIAAIGDSRREGYAIVQ
jgi:gamma-glutamyltranspeptidase/glutathione hydrolase